MPAIQYLMHGSIVVVREPSGYEAIPLWSKKGTAIPVLWLGFIPKERAEKMTNGGWGKMPAKAVTKDSRPACGWKALEPHQYVLCYRVPDGRSESGWGAYSATNVAGWPIVITPPYTTGARAAVV